MVWRAVSEKQADLGLKGGVSGFVVFHLGASRSTLGTIMTNTTIWLSQIQFLSSVGVMAMFFAIELGLIWVLLGFKLGLHFGKSTGWRDAYRLWVRIYAIAAILALAASIPVFLQLGSLWPQLSAVAGDIIGPLLAAAVVTTFVVKSCCSGVVLFGMQRFTPWLHTLFVFLLAAGTFLAAFWLIALQSWMQAPTGAVLSNGYYQAVDWAAVIFNPLLRWVLFWFLATAFAATGFLLMGTSASQSLRHPSATGERLAFDSGLILALASSCLLLLSLLGYSHAVAPYQPAKAAATAAYWDSSSPPRVVVFAWPDQTQRRNKASYQFSSGLAHQWVAHDAEGQRLGLDRLAGMHPPVAITFWSFRLAVFGSLLAIFYCLFIARQRRRHKGQASLLSKRWSRRVSATSYIGWLFVVVSLVYMWLGNAPYVIGNAITQVQLLADNAWPQLLLGILATAAVAVVLVLGFSRLAHYFALFGVVPITRHRGRA